MNALFWLALVAVAGYLLGLTVERWRADGEREDRCDRCPDRWNVVSRPRPDPAASEYAQYGLRKPLFVVDGAKAYGTCDRCKLWVGPGYGPGYREENGLLYHFGCGPIKDVVELNRVERNRTNRP